MNAERPSGYRILGEGRRDFRVTAPDGAVLGEVHFPGWMSNQAAGRIGTSAVRFIAPAVFTRQAYRIELDGREVGTIAFGWRRHCTIVLEIDGRSWTLHMGHKGWFQHGLRLRTEQDIPLVDLRTRWKWFASPDYDLSFPGGRTVSMAVLPLLLTVAGFTSALIRARQAAAAAA